MASTLSSSGPEISESATATWPPTGTTVQPGVLVFGNGKSRVPQPTSVPSRPFENEHLLDLGYAKDNVGSIAVESLRADFSKSIPPNNFNRTLVLCFDGNGDHFNYDNSNIMEFFSMLKKDDPNKQLVYYQAGIDRYTTDIAIPMASSIIRALDMAVAWNLDRHIMGGYEFLMQNYRTNDKICIFGFSRGAYTARCLVGMVHKVGILPTCNHRQVPFAYKLYTKVDEEGWMMSNMFKNAFSVHVDVDFLGVWETVGSVGLIPRRLPFTTSNSSVKTFRQALALDERRAKFQPSHWNRLTQEEIALRDGQKRKMALMRKKHAERQYTKHASEHEHSQSLPSEKEGKPAQNTDLRWLELQWPSEWTEENDFEEVWFAGAHCDIGGGSVSYGTKPCLARIPLRWMIRECFKAKTGILFHVDGIERAGIDPNCLYPEVLARPPPLPLDTYTAVTSIIQGIPKNHPVDDDADDDDLDILFGASLEETEEEADLKDALAPIYDQLNLSWSWWLFEVLPIYVRYQMPDMMWKQVLRLNLGRGRLVPQMHNIGMKIHRTVKTRMEAQHEDGRSYVPAVTNLDPDTVTWVD